MSTRSSRRKHIASRQSHTRTLSRFLDTIVHKVFDSQRKTKDLTPQKQDVHDTHSIKFNRSVDTSPLIEEEGNISIKVNGGQVELSNLSIHESKKQQDQESSGTSDGSLNATHGTKNIEDSVSVVVHDKSAEIFRRPPPSLPRKEPLIIYPQFHFPQGVPVSTMENDSILRQVCRVYRELPHEQSRPASMLDFSVWWRAMTSVAHDEAARFIYTLSYGSRSYLVREDLYGMVMDIMHSHPGLEFCREAVDFHDKYCDVVIARIMWNLGCVWRGRITADSLRKSDFLEKVRQLQEDADINRCLRYFSYEHFYVIYCKFWELDTNHDQLVNKADMRRHKDGAITDIVIDRIFSNAVRNTRKETMNLVDFTNFLLAEEDKTHPTSLEYWFRILDEDGDGLISMYEMERFHQAVIAKLTDEGIESMSFKDVVCQMLDMICPVSSTSFRLSDLKKCPLSVRLLNSLVNWRKFYAQEVTEGSERVLDETGRELSDWERFCSEEYETMMENEEEVDGNFSVYLDDDEPNLSV
ncbi:hypothetical protein DICVIV_12814 [Dictyocaulus viviparus]|uniref:EF-hand domain-containing protein n=1 Tax=Dictyocaulus viviparus TaxID=29172 RepID=A0A0D8X9H8_DICVI|nr:hypothetical protein DICVIV_12814 [Dictyocaulus viviparus]